MLGRLSYIPIGELIRYAIIGITINGLGYFIYIIFTMLGLDPKLVVGFCYPVATYISYKGNKKFTFNIEKGNGKEGVKFVTTHFLAYIMNIALLYLFSDVLGYSHQLIQFISIFILAIFIFFMMKFFVFTNHRS